MKRRLACLLAVLLLLTACGSKPYTPYSGFCKQVVSEDNTHVFVLMEDDSLWVWGWLGWTALGHLPDEEIVIEPMLVKNDILDVSTYMDTTLVVLSDHSLWGVGYLGMDLESDVYLRNELAAYPIKLMEGVRSVLVTNGCIFTITDNNVLYGSGSNKYGVLGLGDEEKRRNFEVIMEDVESVYAGFHDATYIVQTDGTLWACGRNTLYQFPELTESRDSQTTPVKIADNVEKVFHGIYGCYLLKRDSTLWTWGVNLTPGLANETGEMRLLEEGVKDVGDFGSYLGILREDDSLWSLLVGYEEGDEEKAIIRFAHIADDVTSFTKSQHGNYYTTKDGKLYGIDGYADEVNHYLFQLKGVPLDIEQPVVLFQPEESDEGAA